VLPCQSYCRTHQTTPLAPPPPTNYDEPEAFDTPLLQRHIDALRRGESIDRPVYDFTVHDRLADVVRIDPTPVLIVEGILVLADPGLRERCDLKLFVDAPPDERFIRRLQRDVHERGRSADSVIDQYRATVGPMHERYCEPSKRHADLIIPEGGSNRPAMQVLRAYLRQLVIGYDRVSR
jgi:uridine kinase